MGNALIVLKLKLFLIITKKNDEICLIFRRVIAKYNQLKPSKVSIFRYNNTELSCNECLTAT